MERLVARTSRKRPSAPRLVSAGASAPTLGKITPPTLHRVHANQRLFDRLDAARAHRAIWVHGAPGAGKTTLIASYLSARGIRPIWYRLDSGDADPATVFFYMSRAADACGATSPLPLLTMDFRAAVPLFARRFFRDLFAKTKASVVVFDDYQEVDDGSALHACLTAAFEEVPEGCRIVVISRTPPPAPFARLRLNGLLEVVEPDALRMTQAEAAGLARERGAAASCARVEAITRQTQGWAAGVILMLEAGAADFASVPPCANEPLPELLFDYFAGEILQRMAPDQQRLLGIVALMPSMSGVAAEKLAGSADVGALLEDLRKRNYFTTRDVAQATRYRFHPMFRAFLLNSLTYRLLPNELVVFQRNAALALDEDGEPEAAVDLFHAAGAFEDLAALIKRRADTLIKEGRNDTLAAWLALLPFSIVETDAWLNYWFGSARLYHSTDESYAAFTRAFDLFRQADDATGQFLAWGGQAETVRSNPIGNCADFDALIETMDELLVRHPTIPPGPVMLRVALGMANGLWRRSNDRARIALWQRRARGAARDCSIPGLAALVGFIFVIRDLSDGNYAEARDALAVLPDPLVADLPPVARLYGFMAWATAIYDLQMPGDCGAFVDAAIRCQEATGYNGWIFLLAFYAAIDAASRGDIETCGAWVARMRNYSGVLALDRGVHYYFVSAVYEQMRGDRAAARNQADLAIARARDFGWRTLETFPTLVSAELALDCGDFNLASAELDRFDDLASRSTARTYVASADLLRADMAFLRGDAAAGAALLAEALRKAALQGDRRVYFSSLRLSRLLAYALKAGIEPDYARLLIRCASLPSPDPFDGSWPWPIRIKTLGSFSIERDGEPLTFAARRRNG